MNKQNALKYLALIEGSRNTDNAHDHEWRMIAACVAKHYGYDSRSEWIKDLEATQ